MSSQAILCACPFCGERRHLDLGPTFSRPIVVGSDTLRDDGGNEVMEEVAGAVCLVCEAMAPLDVWNRQRSPQVFEVLREFDPPAQQVAA